MFAEWWLSGDRDRRDPWGSSFFIGLATDGGGEQLVSCNALLREPYETGEKLRVRSGCMLVLAGGKWYYCEDWEQSVVSQVDGISGRRGSS